jgi:hypothetical protein
MSAIATMASPAQTARIRRTLGVCNRGAFSSPGGQGSLARWEIPSRTVLGDPRVGPPGRSFCSRCSACSCSFSRFRRSASNRSFSSRSRRSTSSRSFSSRSRCSARRCSPRLRSWVAFVHQRRSGMNLMFHSNGCKAKVKELWNFALQPSHKEPA